MDRSGIRTSEDLVRQNGHIMLGLWRQLAFCQNNFQLLGDKRWSCSPRLLWRSQYNQDSAEESNLLVAVVLQTLVHEYYVPRLACDL